ncbi:MAG: tetratricopeptide repeat protein [Bacteroidaceae bacterium]|nr:tetratricopeptide repeat protein [Bacteroidaceae bacterium]
MRYLLNLFIILVLFAIPATGQNKNTARKLFNEGRYAEAKPMFEKLLKSNPKNSEYSYWYAVCCYETGDSVEIKPLLEFAASRNVVNAYRYLGDYHYDRNEYPAAVDWYSEFIDETNSDSLRQVYQKKYTAVSKLNRMVMNCEKICFVDSFVVDKKDFLSAYRMGSEGGYITTNARFFDDEGLPGYLNCSERGLDIYFSDFDEDNDSLMKLYHNSKIADEWGRATMLKGFDTKGNDNYPFMLSDGVTLYFASDGEGSIGGYDLFVTRLDIETGRFLRPDHLAMPFNSVANDYMLAINEVANLGWFATDRNQPEGLVCVYVFIPSPDKECYDTDDFGKLFSYAQISSIAATQTDGEALRKARQQLTILHYEQNAGTRKGDFLFVVDDRLDYKSLSDFKSEKARALFVEWQKKEAQLRQDVTLLEQKRDEYSSANAGMKNSMRNTILTLERKIESEQQELERMEYEVRRLEHDAVYNK